jgi:hypothetical protein
MTQVLSFTADIHHLSINIFAKEKKIYISYVDNKYVSHGLKALIRYNLVERDSLMKTKRGLN